MTKMVTITQDEYARLRGAAEDLADLQAYDRIKARIASGEDELIPAEYANRLLDGENPLRVWRHYRGLTQVRLSEVASVNRVQIADIEAGRKHGSIATIARLARALKVDIDDLIDVDS